MQLLSLWAASRAFLVPTYDQDLMWHAHMSHPLAYAADCFRICGRPIDHDDSVTDRSVGSRLATGASATEELWARAYPGETWRKQGGMFRGHPPDWYWAYPGIAAMAGGPVPPVELTDPHIVARAGGGGLNDGDDDEGCVGERCGGARSVVVAVALALSAALTARAAWAGGGGGWEGTALSAPR